MTIAGINQALSAYAAAAKRLQAPLQAGAGASPFETMMRAELEGAKGALEAGEAKSVEALTGKASLQEVVEAVATAELSLQRVTAVRDRVISAYQEIMRMPV
jgi:flagellar hook-basal body complex protein FliE